MNLSNLITKVIDVFYIKPISRLISRQTYTYAVCGGVNMTLDIIYYYLIYHFIFNKEFVDLGVVVISPHIAAFIVVFPITFFNGFWLNKNITFRHSVLRTKTQLIRYAISVTGALLLNYICLKLFVDEFGFWATPAKALATLISIVYSFVMAKFYTFKEIR